MRSRKTNYTNVTKASFDHLLDLKSAYLASLKAKDANQYWSKAGIKIVDKEITRRLTSSSPESTE